MFGAYSHPLLLRLNIDPVGHDISPYDVLDVARQFPWADIDYRIADKASFPKAFTWVLDHTDTPFTFNLEEDWELLRTVDLLSMLGMMANDFRLVILRLPIFHADLNDMKNWKCWYPWNGQYFECPEMRRLDLGFCGHPSLIRTSWLQGALPRIDDRYNPEKQFHTTALCNAVLPWRYGVYGHPDGPPYIRDIGRGWMAVNGWTKAGTPAFFTEWRKADE